MMGLLPVLCDGVEGIAAYIPVKHEGKLQIVLSTTIMEKLMESYCNVRRTDIKNDIRSNAKKVPVTAAQFRAIMLKTPFKPYKMGPKMKDANWLKNNLEVYVVADAEWFKGLIKEIEKRCEVPGEIPDGVKALKLYRTMAQSFSVSAHYSIGAKVYESMGDKCYLSDEQLSQMPAMHWPWCEEAYGGGCADYFGMRKVDGEWGVVSAGKYVEPHTNEDGREVKARAYGVVLASLRKHFWENFDKEVIAATPHLFPASASKGSEGKRKSS